MADNIDQKITLMSLFRGLMMCYFNRMYAANLNVEQAAENLRDGFVKKVLQARDLTQEQLNERLAEYMSRIKNSKTMDELYDSSNKGIEILAR